jgi:hypothetical protein
MHEDLVEKIQHCFTEIDLILWQWQADLDMLALAGVEVPLVLHMDGEAVGIGEARLFHNDGALAMTGENIVAPEFADMQAWRYLRPNAKPYFEDPIDPLPLVLHKDGERRVVGFAQYEVLPNGDIMATGTITEPVPELTAGVLDAYSVSMASSGYMSISKDIEPLAHYSLMPDGRFFNNITKKFVPEKDLSKESNAPD